jgi:hypothetical protein
MDNFIEKAIRNIDEKLGWASRSFDKLQANKKDQNEIKDNFWSFLSAFQQGWYYFNKLIVELTPDLSKKKQEDLSKTLINDWKIMNLTESQRISWDVLNRLRNHDTHYDPVKANYEIRLELITDSDGDIFTDYDGTPFMANCGGVYITFNNKEYDIEFLITNGLDSIRKLIEYLPNIKNNWC